MRRAIVSSMLLFSACGEETPAHTSILEVSLEDEIPEAERESLIGIAHRERTVSFPDGEGTIVVTAAHARSPAGGLYVRTIDVEVEDAAGYTITAQVIGAPTNRGTEAEPVHSRLVQVSRTRSGLSGSSSSTMTLAVSPSGVDVM